MCVHVCVHTHTCVCDRCVCRRRLLSLGTGLQVVVGGLDVANPIRMLEQQGLPAAEPSLALLSFLLI